MMSRYHRRIEPLRIPPKSIRFCLNCERDTKWEFNQNIGHSECLECGGRKCIHPILAEHFKGLLKRISELEKTHHIVNENKIVTYINKRIKQFGNTPNEGRIKELNQLKKLIENHEVETAIEKMVGNEL